MDLITDRIRWNDQDNKGQKWFWLNLMWCSILVIPFLGFMFLDYFLWTKQYGWALSTFNGSQWFIFILSLLGSLILGFIFWFLIDHMFIIYD